jgi:hypothetical protein
MTPILGQGANQALGDAVVLAAVAAEPDGLATYDKLRRPRSQQVARASRAIGRLGMQLENPIAVAGIADLAGHVRGVVPQPDGCLTAAVVRWAMRRSWRGSW